MLQTALPGSFLCSRLVLNKPFAFDGSLINGWLFLRSLLGIPNISTTLGINIRSCSIPSRWTHPLHGISRYITFPGTHPTFAWRTSKRTSPGWGRPIFSTFRPSAGRGRLPILCVCPVGGRTPTRSQTTTSNVSRRASCLALKGLAFGLLDLALIPHRAVAFGVLSQGLRKGENQAKQRQAKHLGQPAVGSGPILDSRVQRRQ